MCEDVEIAMSVGYTVLCHSEIGNKRWKRADFALMAILL